MTLDADVIILGGGCAGLSLATALAERAPDLRVTTLEARSHYVRDRTWCFWNTMQHSFAAGVTHQWHQWRVRHAGAEIRHGSRLYSYQCLPADRFYDLACAKLRRAGQELAFPVNVRAVRETSKDCEVESDQGTLRSKWVFDSRTPQTSERQPVLEQRFTGWHVQTERPCFDSSTVDLMSFQESEETGRTAFFYVLPFSPTEALVEATFLDAPELAAPDAEASLSEHMHHLCGTAYKICYKESATLPMGNRGQAPVRNGHIIDIGTRGGRIKASSGYGFQRIQSQSVAFAEALARNSPLPPRVESRVYDVLDRVFLNALQSAPHRAAAYFVALFDKLPPETLVRFLSETASGKEVLRVMLALPKTDFLKAALLPRFSRSMS